MPNVKRACPVHFGHASRKTILTAQKLKYKNAEWQVGKRVFRIKNISRPLRLSFRLISNEVRQHEGIICSEEDYGEGTSRPKIITASASLTKPFFWGKQPWQWQSSLNAQWNKTPLVPQDRFSIGGRYTIRGFDGELTLSGERGWNWRNELSWQFNPNHAFYWAVDGGRVSGWATENQLGHHLMGTAIGFGVELKDLVMTCLPVDRCENRKGLKPQTPLPVLILVTIFNE
ncbi:Uncharacterised protein [Mannheimia haemolytica]|uniref:Haemolysin activator HlyB C-terminal domain-containing protein n=1 Tax=Mannheimia haemolytica TaxID=75985 RepID=A0A378N5T3_MANHA|nr:Uncharacterised protein [Mannheimia haemolytica]